MVLFNINFIGLFILSIVVFALVREGPSTHQIESFVSRPLSRLITLVMGALLLGQQLTLYDVPLLSFFNFLFNTVLLWVHEGGHGAFFWAPRVVHVLMGTGFQLGLPLLLAIRFWSKGCHFSRDLSLFFVGHQLIQAAPYIGDARARALPLLGGSDYEHDWAYILGTLGVLEYDTSLAVIASVSGTLLGLAALVLLAVEKRIDPDR